MTVSIFIKISLGEISADRKKPDDPIFNTKKFYIFNVSHFYGKNDFTYGAHCTSLSLSSYQPSFLSN